MSNSQHHPKFRFENLDDLKASRSILYECIVGSHAHGTSTPQSDLDTRGVFALPKECYPSIFLPQQEVADDEQDIKFFELTKFLSLASECNPSVIELLWVPEDCIRYTTPAWEEIIKRRSLFISRKALGTFSGYAYAQIKKARGQNKMVMKEWPIEKPNKKDFCWIILAGNGHRISGFPPTLPGRPVPINKTGWMLEEFNAAKLEHVPNMFRLYHYEEKAKGVFRGDGMLACENIPIEDETNRFAGFLIWNEPAYEQALRDHQRYWTWKAERNEARWEGQDGDEFKYDRKNMMHCMRLVLSGKALLQTGEPIVRFEGEKLQLLKDIRAGKYEFDDIMTTVEEEIEGLKKLCDNSSLPEESDKDAIDKLCKDVYAIYLNS